MNRPSVFGRLLVLFLCLLLPLIAVGGYFLIENVEMLQKSTDENIELSLLEQRRALEQRVDNVQYALQSLVDEEIHAREFLVYGQSYQPPQYWTLVGNVMKDMKRIRRSEDLLESITLYYPTLSLQISTSRGVTVMDEAEYQKVLQASRSQRWGLNAVENAFVISYSFPFSATDSSVPKMTLVAKLSNTALREVLAAGGDVGMISMHGSAQVITREALASAVEDADGRVLVDGDRFRVVKTTSSILGCKLMRYVPEKLLSQKLDRLAAMMLAYFLLVIPIAFLYILSIQKLVQRPIRTLMHALRDMRGGKLDFQIENTASTRELSELIEGFNEMLKQLDHQIQTRYQMEVYTRSVELKHLQAQINPHFLYNTLYMLRHMIDDEDIENASLLAAYLGGYFRYIYDTHSLEISLENEYTHAKNYLNIQCMRFGRRLKSNLPPLPEEMKSLCVPKLILQPLYENAILHAMNGEAPLEVSTRFSLCGGRAIIAVEDNGRILTEESLQRLKERTFSDDAEDLPTALSNIRKRLQLRYGADYTMQLSMQSHGGLCIVITLPCEGGRGD